MSVTIQVRDVPEDLRRKLMERAAFEGLSLSDYLLREIRRLAELPALEELKARLHSRPRANPPLSAAEAVRAERDRE